MNLCELLKGHGGETFYSSIFGDVTILSTSNNQITIRDIDELLISFDEEGRFSENGECVLFPSKDQRDWDIWLEEQNPKTLEHLVRAKKLDSGEIILRYGGFYKGSDGLDLNRIKSAVALYRIQEIIEKCYGGIGDSQVAIMSSRAGYYVTYILSPYPVMFKTKELAEEFLSYKSNVELLNDYFRIS